MTTFTIEHRNSMLGRAHRCGTFESQERAEEEARRLAARCRDFMSFAVFRGTPRAPLGNALFILKNGEENRP